MWFETLFSTYAPGVCARAKSIQVPTHSCWPHLRFALNLCARVCAQVCAEPEAPMGCLGQSSFETGYAPGMRQPHSSLVIWIHLEHEQALAGFNLEQGYASGVCACQATPSTSPKCLSTKNRYALGMRWPHSSLGIWIHAEHGLDSARTLVSLRYLCAGGMRPIYIYAG